MFRPAALLIGLPLVLFCQTVPQKPRTPRRFDWVRTEIKIVEGETEIPMAGAEVIVSGSSALQKSYERRITTANDGTINLTLVWPGLYTISLASGDYVPALDASPVIDFTGQAQPPASPFNVKLAYFRESEISGELVDYDSGEPLKDVHIGVLQCKFWKGIRQLIAKPSLKATTTADGHFVIGNVPPGEYVLEIGAPTAEELTKMADLPEVKGPKRILWPGADNSDSLHILSNSREHVGTIQLHSGTLPGVALSVHADSCRVATRYSVFLYEFFGKSPVQRGEFPLTCDAPLRLRGFTPGRYEFQVNDRADIHASDSSDVRRAGFAEIEIERMDKQTDVSVADPLPITGQVIVESQEQTSNPQPVASFRIQLRPQPERPVITLPVPQSSATSSDGSFEASVIVDPEKKVRVIPLGLPGTFALKSVIYNGVAFPGAVFEANPLLNQHRLTLVLSDKLAKISGKIADAPAGADLKQVQVLAVPWPVETENLYPVQVTETSAQDDGTFEFDGMLAGEYKLLAVNRVHRAELEKPGRLLNLLTGIDAVSVAAGATVETNAKVKLP